jgi:hypothetical protein
MAFIVQSPNGGRGDMQFAMKVGDDVFWTFSKAKATRFDEVDADRIIEEINRYASTPAEACGAAPVGPEAGDYHADRFLAAEDLHR